MPIPMDEIPDFQSILSQELDKFTEKLTYRWQLLLIPQRDWDSYYHADFESRPEFPLYLTREGAPTSRGAERSFAWNFWEGGAKKHLESGNCNYIDWLSRGRQESLEEVQPCFGKISNRDYVACRMKDVLRQIEDWAWEERNQLFDRLSVFSQYDNRAAVALGGSHGAFLKVGGVLGLQEATKEHNNLLPSLPAEQYEYLNLKDKGSSAGSLEETLDYLLRQGGSWQELWEDWTGRAGSQAKRGFFSSIRPTFENQAMIFGFLANLYAVRAAIAEEAQDKAIELVRQTTEALDPQVVRVDYSGVWKTLNGFSKLLPVVVLLPWLGAGTAAIGATMGLVAFAGENLYKEESLVIRTDLDNLMDDIRELSDRIHQDAQSREDGAYAKMISQVQQKVNERHSFDLELYDVTANDPSGRSGARRNDDTNPENDESVGRDPDTIRSAATPCESFAEYYQNDILPWLSTADEGKSFLVDKDGVQTDNDRAVLELQDLADSLIGTTIARFRYAAELFRKTADAYEENDAEILEEIDKIETEIVVDAAPSERSDDLAADNEANEGVGEHEVYRTEEMLEGGPRSGAHSQGEKVANEAIENLLNDT